ncbi:benzoate/H(+) symporter BenE family transporter [Marinobacter salarius]|uniref:benzoate/H(+) symporter BenE family transporter n=1 Tax=Marinobacter salarius TaxID=1420917 RepID=UPI003D9C3B83
MIQDLRRDFSLSAATAGVIALLATYTGSVLVVVEAANAGQLSQSLLSTWIFAVSFGGGVSGLWLSLRYKVPVIGAWSTPSVVLLIFALTQYSFGEAVACYLLLSILVTLLAYTGWLAKLISVLPQSLLSAMIAGVLLSFCTQIFQSLQSVPNIILPVVIGYVIFRRFVPRYAVALALLTGLAFAFPEFSFNGAYEGFHLVSPVMTTPIFSGEALVGLGVPLFLLALTQHATGLHILQNEGFDVSAKQVVGVCGLISVPLSLFGSSGANPAAIIGAICAGSECHEDPSKRYISGVVCGIGYIFIGLFGASIITLFAQLPGQLITSLAGLALFGTLISSLTSSLEAEDTREAAMITFVVTASGMSFFNLGSALWGLLFGILFSMAMSRGNSTVEQT